MDTAQSVHELFRSFHGFEDRNAFAEIFNLDSNTFARWQREKFTGKGTNLIRIRVALKYAGYTLSDEQFSDAVFAEICEAITFNIIDIKDVGQAMRLKTDKDVYRLLLQNRSTSSYRLGHARDLVSKNYSKLTVQRQLAREALAKLSVIRVSKPFVAQNSEDCIGERENEPPISKTLVRSTKNSNPLGMCFSSQEMLEIFGGLLNAMRPVLEYFNNADPEVRKDLRKHVGYAEISEVTELFRNVTSEKYKQEKHKQPQSTQQKGR